MTIKAAVYILETRNIPSNFLNLCVHKISFVQPFTTINLYVKWSIRNMCKNIFGKNISVHSKFSCVSSFYYLCMRAQAHSLEETLCKTVMKVV